MIYSQFCTKVAKVGLAKNFPYIRFNTVNIQYQIVPILESFFAENAKKWFF